MNFTEEQDARILEMYKPETYVRGSIAEQARVWGCTCSKIHFRRVKLKIQANKTYKMKKQWATEEVAILNRYNHYTNVAVKAVLEKKGFSRTVEAIKSYRYRTGWYSRYERDEFAVGYSANQLAEILSVNTSTILRWIEKGVLPAKAEGGVNQPHAYRIKLDSLKSFLINNINLWEPGKVDKYWLMDILK